MPKELWIRNVTSFLKKTLFLIIIYQTLKKRVYVLKKKIDLKSSESQST